MYYSPQWRDEDEEIVDDPDVIRLACWATGVYDKEDSWYSGQIPDDVWQVVDEGRVQAVCEWIEGGSSWATARTYAGRDR